MSEDELRHNLAYPYRNAAWNPASRGRPLATQPNRRAVIRANAAHHPAVFRLYPRANAVPRDCATPADHTYQLWVAAPRATWFFPNPRICAGLRNIRPLRVSDNVI